MRTRMTSSVGLVAAALAIALALPACDHASGRCRLNEGWPCTCDDLGGHCKDGAPCVNLKESFPSSAPSAAAGTHGYCAQPCADPQEDLCEETDWGQGQLCFAETLTDEIYLCVLYCQKDAHCPPGQECTEAEYCHPRGD